ncbi:hypothetical protein [Luteimonas sp. 3794]|uniref:hypothetical protein n=1 Tax=Luteimonas sp. 3794 TaxID=2817730 RepID=UPI00285AA56C|nr:hypothetical protein [Luteimonas sp. 3794]MDR6990301.1 hypothetical protein [Luteimonas sp. 3794]
MPALDAPAFLAHYLTVLQHHGSPTPRVLAPLVDAVALDRLAALPGVSPPPALLAYFRAVDGTDPDACDALGLFEPHLAWRMTALSLAEALQTHHDLASHEDDENPDYWPRGFIPLLADGAGSYLVVNAIAGSPTWGAVYDMGQGVGCNRLAHSLPAFFDASARQIEAGLLRFEGGASRPAVEPREYVRRTAELFGHPPCFASPGSQIVDWTP